MEWFKHKTSSLDDPDFSAIIDEFGSDGYMMFFGLLEIYGREYSNTDSEQFLNVRLAFVARKLRKSSAKVRKFLNFCEKLISKPRFEHSINGAILSYKAPDFIELSSNWTKRKKKTPTEAPTEAPTAIEEEVEEEVEERIKNKEKKRMFNQKEFDVFYSVYPKKTGKTEVLTRWKKLIKSNELPELTEILSAIKKQVAWRENSNGAFRPEWKNPATWLNKGCWTDEIEEPEKDDPWEGRL